MFLGMLYVCQGGKATKWESQAVFLLSCHSILFSLDELLEVMKAHIEVQECSTGNQLLQRNKMRAPALFLQGVKQYRVFSL